MKYSKESKIDEKIIDFFLKRGRLWLLAIFILGLILRVIVSSNLPPVEDESGSITHAIGFSRLAPLSQMAQAQVWFYLTDYSFRIFGVSLLTGRLLSVIFGSLSIILVYLIASYLFNKKTGLVAAFLLAISAYHITWTASYQDQTMMFFVLIASYFFIREYRERGTISLWSALFLAISELVKIITGVFVLVFGFFSIWILYKNYKNDKKLFKINLRRVIFSIAILALAMTPILAYNFFLFKEKGIVDLPFAQFLRINPEFYMGPGLHHGEGFVIHKLIINLYSVITLYFIREDVLIFLLAIAGIAFSLFKFKKISFGERFLLVMFIFVLCFIASAIVLQTHYTSFFPLMSIFAAIFIVHMSNTEMIKKYHKHFIIGILIFIMLFNLWNIREPLTSQSALQKIRSFTVSSITEKDLLLVDSRIYVGTYSWLFNDKNYIDASLFTQIMQINTGYNGTRYPMKVYFVECVREDCGWGTINNNPELNASMEFLAGQFENNSIKVRDIEGGGSITGVRGIEIQGETFYKVYMTTIPLPYEILELTKQTHKHFFYRIPRDADPQNAFDYYTVKGMGDKTLNFIAYCVLYLIVGMAALSVFVPFYLLNRYD